MTNLQAPKFSNHWKKTFQSLEKTAKIFQPLEKNFPIIGKLFPRPVLPVFPVLVVLALLALLALPLPAHAQIELTWTLEHNRTLLMEPIRADITIANYTGVPLDFAPDGAAGNARLLFTVEDDPSSYVRASGKPLLQEPLRVPDGESRTVTVDVLQAYRVVRGQSYMLQPEVAFGGMRFSGRRLSLEVQPGLEILTRTYGIPSAGNARKVSLRTLNRDRVEHLFFRLDDPSNGYCLCAVDLGGLIRFVEPTLQMDNRNVFHVLHQSQPDRFSHAMFSHDGTPLGTEFYIAATGSIRLVREPDGTVSVIGGTRFEPDPDHPGKLTAPNLPPSHNYPTTLGAPEPAAR